MNATSIGLNRENFPEGPGLLHGVHETWQLQKRRYDMVVGSLALKDTLGLLSQFALGIKPPQMSPKRLWAKEGYLDKPFMLRRRPADLYIFWEVAIKGEYNLPKSLDRLIDGKPIVDIGGNIGTSMASFASRYRNSPILTVEPHPMSAAQLRRNAAFYGDRVIVEQRAFSLEEGNIPLARPEKEDLSQHITYMFQLSGSNAHTSAPSITPEQIADYPLIAGNRIGLLKVDIEGAEVDIFRSGRMGALLSKTNVLAVESHDDFVPGSLEAINNATAANNLVRFGGSTRAATHYYLAAQHLDLVA